MLHGTRGELLESAAAAETDDGRVEREASVHDMVAHPVAPGRLSAKGGLGSPHSSSHYLMVGA